MILAGSRQTDGLFHEVAPIVCGAGERRGPASFLTRPEAHLLGARALSGVTTRTTSQPPARASIQPPHPTGAMPMPAGSASFAR